MTGSSVPEAAERRLATESFSSGLTVPDFAACLQMGLRPVGLVQGFCAMQWGWYGGAQSLRGLSPLGVGDGGYSRVWYCPHGFVSAEHPTWGQNAEQTWVEDAWAAGFDSAFARMLEEARALGANGVIGVKDTSRSTQANVTEFHVLGTAVKLEGAAQGAASDPWSTYLAGQRLAKLIEAGFAPVSVVATLSSVRVWSYCMTRALMEGYGYSMGAIGASGWAGGGSLGAAQEVDQVTEARIAARQIAKERLRQRLGGDILHGALVGSFVRELGEGDQVVECTLRGTRVRRFKDFDPIEAPVVTVRLS